MYDLTTVQRLNREAQERYEEKKWELAMMLDHMLYDWDNESIDDVPTFLEEWAVKIMRLR